MIRRTEATERRYRKAVLQSGDRIRVDLIPDPTDKENDLFKISFYGVYQRRLENGKTEEMKTSPSWRLASWPTSNLPESRESRKEYNTYYVPITDSNVSVFQQCFEEEIKKDNSQITFSSIARMAYDDILDCIEDQEKAALIVAKWREKDILPPSAKLIKKHKKFPLKPHQLVARHNFLNNLGYAFFMKQGTGKTAPTVDGICELAIRKRHKEEMKKKIYEKKNPGKTYTIKPLRAIVVCPKNVRFNWENEFKKFGRCKGRITIIRGNQIDREKQVMFSLMAENKLKRDPKFDTYTVHGELGTKEENEDSNAPELFSLVICSYGSLAASTDALCLRSLLGKKLNRDKVYWDVAVLDESHFIKTPSAKRTKACFKLRDSSKRRLILTGTPLTNNLFDLWSQFEFIEKGASGASTFKAFKSQYGEYTLDQMSGFARLEGFKNVPLLQERMARRSLIVTKEEVLPDLPPKVYDSIECYMTKEQRKIYSQVLSQINIEIDTQIERDAVQGKPAKMTVSNILTKLLRLAQVTSGHVKYDDTYDDDGNLIEKGRIDRFDPNPKIEALVEELKKKGPNSKTLIWCCFTPDVKTIAARLKIEGIKTVMFYGDTKEDDRKKAMDDFNCDPETKVMVGNAAAGGVGTNLLGFDPMHPEKYETNCDHIIYFSQNWSPTVREQSEDRPHRNGTRVPVRVSNLVIPGTVDMEIRTRVEDKREAAKQVSEVRGILTNLLRGLDMTKSEVAD